MSAEVVTWSDPPGPAVGSGSSEYDALLAALQERPRQWALIAKEVDNKTANRFYRGLTKRRCDVARRASSVDDRWHVWARLRPIASEVSA